MWLLRQKPPVTSLRLPLVKSPLSSGRIPWRLIGNIRRIECSRRKHSPLDSHLIEPLPSDLNRNNRVNRKINEIRHYLRTADVHENRRRSVLRDKLISLVKGTDDLLSNPEIIPTLNLVILNFQQSDDNLEKIIPFPELIAIFNRTASCIHKLEQPEYPRFMAVLAIHFLKSQTPIPAEVLVNCMKMGSLLRFGDFQSSLSFVLSYRALSLPADFLPQLLQSFWDSNELDLEKFETIAKLNLLSPEIRLINDDVVTKFYSFLEYLFNDTSPNVHEYKDSERNIYRVLFIVNDFVAGCLESATVESLLKLLKLKSSLNLVVSRIEDSMCIRSIIQQLSIGGRKNEYEDLTTVLFRQDLFDESLSEVVLHEAVAHHQYAKELCLRVSDFISSNDVKFSASLRLRATIAKTVLASETHSVDRICKIITQECSPIFKESEDKSKVLSDVCQILMLMDDLPHEQVFRFLSQKFARDHDIDLLEIYFFKYCLDRALSSEDVKFAKLIYFGGLQSSAPWNECEDPSITFSLNKLIQLIVTDSADIKQAFPLFKNIRLHINGSLDAQTLTTLAQAMLAENCVGDVIEMLKRELPKMNKESYRKLVVKEPWSWAHASLFNTILNYVTSYKGDDTSETNWALYGVVHDYFQMPYESYQPVLEFFCEVDRLNAALTVFRTVILLSDLHGDKNPNLPPLKEMYMYLLKVFGEKLYEEGVLELQESLNMDIHLDNQDIDLQNCLLEAFTNLQDIIKARDVFLSISANPKEGGGVNEETAQIMIKALTYSDITYVDRFWNNLLTYGVFPNHKVFKQYVIAHVYHGLIDKATTIVSNIDDYNLEVTPDILLAMHNYCLEPHKQKEVEVWLRNNFKEEWEQLRLSGLLRSAEKHEPETPLLVEGQI